jgi:hypothetical protein
VKRDVAATALDVHAAGRAASGQRRRDEGGTTRRWPGLGRGRGRGQARCAGGARLLRRRGCAHGACTPGQWTCCALRDTMAGRGLAGERRRARRGAARTQRTHTVGERMGKGREDGASSPRRTNGGAPAVIHSEVVTRGGDGGRETAQKSRTVRFWRRRGRENCVEPFWGRYTVLLTRGPTSSGDGALRARSWARWARWACGWAGIARELGRRDAGARAGPARGSWAAATQARELGALPSSARGTGTRAPLTSGRGRSWAGIAGRAGAGVGRTRSWPTRERIRAVGRGGRKRGGGGPGGAGLLFLFLFLSLFFLFSIYFSLTLCTNK